MPRWKFPRIIRVVDVDPILDRLYLLETAMSAQSEALANLQTAIDGAVSRVNADVTHLRELLEQALATSPDQTAEIEALKADADATVDSLWGATAQLNSIDPISDFPAAEPEPDA